VTDRNKLLVEALQALRPTQLDRLMRSAQKRGLSIGEVVALAIRKRLALMSWEERTEVVQQFKEESGIDLEEIL
jgi:hypothetical protein